jgi:hypothetical protein
VSEVAIKYGHSYNTLENVVVEFIFKLEVLQQIEDIRQN